VILAPVADVEVVPPVVTSPPVERTEIFPVVLLKPTVELLADETNVAFPLELSEAVELIVPAEIYRVPAEVTVAELLKVFAPDEYMEMFPLFVVWSVLLTVIAPP
jgi:hypothetical protein